MCEIAVVGLAVMGRNLALNWEEKGRRVAVYNRTWQVTADFLAENPGKRRAVRPAGKAAEDPADGQSRPAGG